MDNYIISEESYDRLAPAKPDKILVLLPLWEIHIKKLVKKMYMRGGIKMFNLNNKKTQKVISSVIIILLVLAMVVPTLLYFL